VNLNKAGALLNHAKQSAKIVAQLLWLHKGAFWNQFIIFFRKIIAVMVTCKRTTFFKAN